MTVTAPPQGAPPDDETTACPTCGSRCRIGSSPYIGEYKTMWYERIDTPEAVLEAFGEFVVGLGVVSEIMYHDHKRAFLAEWEGRFDDSAPDR